MPELTCYGFLRTSEDLLKIVIPDDNSALCYAFFRIPTKQITPYVFIMGGLTTIRGFYNNIWRPTKKYNSYGDKFISNDGIFVCDIHNHKWYDIDRKDSKGDRYTMGGLYTHRHSFGIINYNDQYLFHLGGVE